MKPIRVRAILFTTLLGQTLSAQTADWASLRLTINQDYSPPPKRPVSQYLQPPNRLTIKRFFSVPAGFEVVLKRDPGKRY